MALEKFTKKIFPNKYEAISNFGEEQEPIIGENEETKQNKISSFNAFWNICNSIQGVAILAMPYVIKGGGWWSIVVMVVVSAISNYTGQILIKCHYEDVTDDTTGEIIPLRTRVSYADIGDSIWPVHGKNIVLIVQVLELLFMATLYPLVAASVMSALSPNIGISSAVWVFIFGICMLPNVFLRHLYHISIMSTVTVSAATLVFLAIILYCVTDADEWHVHNLDAFSLKEFVASIGVVVASYSSQMYLSVIESDMKNPAQVGVVMNAGYSAMTILKIGIGTIAYMTFGNDTSQVVTLNLPSGVLLTMVNVVVLILALSSYTLPMFTVFEILEKDSKWLINGGLSDNRVDIESEETNITRQKYVEARRTFVRIVLLLVTLLMAVSVPHFCLLLSFIGSFTGAFLEMVFPCCFYLILKYDKVSKCTIIFNLCIIVSSLMFMGIGMYFSAVAIAKAFKLHTKEVWTVD